MEKAYILHGVKIQKKIIYKMDNIIAESYDSMVNSLNFGLPETSQYVVNCRFANFFPSGSNVYNPNAGNKNIRFNISAARMTTTTWSYLPSGYLQHCKTQMEQEIIS